MSANYFREAVSGYSFRISTIQFYNFVFIILHESDIVNNFAI